MDPGGLDSSVGIFNAIAGHFVCFCRSDIYIRSKAIMVAVNGSGGVYIAARIDKTGCDTFQARGLFFFLFPNDQLFLLTSNVGEFSLVLPTKIVGGVSRSSCSPTMWMSSLSSFSSRLWVSESVFLLTRYVGEFSLVLLTKAVGGVNRSSCSPTMWVSSVSSLSPRLWEA